MSDNLSEEQRKEVLEMQVVTKVAVIAQMCKIIEGCTQRGAFKSDEMSYIGGIYDSLNNVVKQSVAKVLETSNEQETEEKTTEEKSVEIVEEEVEGIEEE